MTDLTIEKEDREDRHGRYVARIQGIDAEGEITFTIGEEKITATQGMFANMPVGILHSFKNNSSKPARMIISVAPAGLEKMFFEFGVPLEEGATEALPPTKEEIDKLLKIAPNYGIEIKVPGH